MRIQTAAAANRTLACRRFYLYHTVCEVRLHLYGGDAEALLDSCEKTARQAQAMLNIYDPASELSRLNSGYTAGKPYRVSRPLFNLLHEIDAFSRACGGAFDITVGPAVRLWDFTARRPRVPDRTALRKTMERVGYEHIHYDTASETVTIDRQGMLLDAGGAGKGYAVGLVAALLRAAGVGSASVNFGGNLYALGSMQIAESAPRPWRVGIQRPWAERGEPVCSVYLDNRAVSTSGGYDRFFTQDNNVYHHILDPRTGWPVESDLLSVSVITPDALLSDLLSTAFFVLGPQHGAELVEKQPGQTPASYVLVRESGVTASRCLAGSIDPEPHHNAYRRDCIEQTS